MVPVVDLSRRGRQVAAQFAELAAEVSSSGQYLLGEQTDAFESEFGAWLDRNAIRRQPKHVTTVSSGASASAARARRARCRCGRRGHRPRIHCGSDRLRRVRSGGDAGARRRPCRYCQPRSGARGWCDDSCHPCSDRRRPLRTSLGSALTGSARDRGRRAGARRGPRPRGPGRRGVQLLPDQEPGRDRRRWSRGDGGSRAGRQGAATPGARHDRDVRARGHLPELPHVRAGGGVVATAALLRSKPTTRGAATSPRTSARLRRTCTGSSRTTTMCSTSACSGAEIVTTSGRLWQRWMSAPQFTIPSRSRSSRHIAASP